jgi:hypothetical protein
MTRKELLPGVTSSECPPSIVCDSRTSIRRARLRATARDIAQILLLAGVDYLFIDWPGTHLPFMNRHDSLLVVAAVNAATLTWLWMSRLVPRWTARRIAATWSHTERRRFERW